MSETKNTQENETGQEKNSEPEKDNKIRFTPFEFHEGVGISTFSYGEHNLRPIMIFVLGHMNERLDWTVLTNTIRLAWAVNPGAEFNPWETAFKSWEIATHGQPPKSLPSIKEWEEASHATKELREKASQAVQERQEEASKAAQERQEEAPSQIKNMHLTITLRINEEPLTPQTLATTFTSLTELTTKLWLIANHRFADLIEYTQTHDVRFANEAGVTITRASYNSPFNFDLKFDISATGVADATMTVVNGLSQRKAKQEQVEIDNQAAAQRIKEAVEALEQQQKYSELEQEKTRLGLERLMLENEKERQALSERRLESRIKQFENALELAGKAVDIVYPNADEEIRPVLIQTLVNNILQLDNINGLQIALPIPKSDDAETKEDAE